MFAIFISRHFRFFSTWCGSCVEALPKLDSLQKQSGNKVQIMVVDYERPDIVRTFWAKNPTGRLSSLPFIIADSLLSSYFPHRIVPPMKHGLIKTAKYSPLRPLIM